MVKNIVKGIFKLVKISRSKDNRKRPLTLKKTKKLCRYFCKNEMMTLYRNTIVDILNIFGKRGHAADLKTQLTHGW